MHEILVNNPYPKKRRLTEKSEISREKMNEELKQLEKVCEKLRSDCNYQRQLIEKLEENIRALKSAAATTEPSSDP